MEARVREADMKVDIYIKIKSANDVTTHIQGTICIPVLYWWENEGPPGKRAEKWHLL